VGQWVLLVVFGLIALFFGLLSAATVVLALQDSGFDRYWFPTALALGLSLLFGTLARNRVYRLIGKGVPTGSGGGTYV